MPRIRTIKPEYWGDEKLAPLAPIDRLVFLGLISMADDAGRLIDNVKSIDGFIFPETDDSARTSLDTLASASRIVRYRAASGQKIIQIAGWTRHQKVDKPSRHVLPDPAPAPTVSTGAATIPETLANDSRESRESVEDSSRSDLGPRTMDLGAGTVDLRERENTGEGAAVTDMAQIAHSALAGLMGDVGMAKVDEFLLTRRRPTHENWYKELAILIGPAGRYTAEDLDGAMRDALIVTEPVEGPHAIRAFCATRAKERLRASGGASAATAPGGRLVAIAAGVSKRDEAVAEAGEIVSRIRQMAEEQYTQGSGTKRYIAADKVRALGAEIFKAYTDAGGMGRFLSLEAKPEDIGFLIRDFASNLARARNSDRARAAS